MKTFFLLLFFSKTVLLTPVPISIGSDWIEVNPDETFSAITGGAAIYIDVSSYVSAELDLSQQVEVVENQFPNGSITGIIFDEDEKEYSVANKGSSHGADSVRLLMNFGAPMPTDVEFTKIVLRSDKQLEQVSVYWKNGKH